MLCERLIPKELKDQATGWNRGSTIYISTNEKWIPWELIHDGDDFWGRKFVLARYPRIPGSSAFPDLNEDLERDDSPYLGTIVNVIGGGSGLDRLEVEKVSNMFTEIIRDELAKAVEEGTAAEIFRRLAKGDLGHVGEETINEVTIALTKANLVPQRDRSLAGLLTSLTKADLAQMEAETLDEIVLAIAKLYLITVHEGSIDDALRAMEDSDIVHFTCHGHRTPHHCLQLTDAHPSATHCLTPIHVQGLDSLRGSLVFVNACRSEIPTACLGEFHTFGWAFYNQGAAACIGTLGPVPIDYAVAFAKRFHEHLLAGKTVGEALGSAKSEAIEDEHENPFWLLYALYGDPSLKKMVTNNHYTPDNKR
jgi:hypothetical protein